MIVNGTLSLSKPLIFYNYVMAPDADDPNLGAGMHLEHGNKYNAFKS